MYKYNIGEDIEFYYNDCDREYMELLFEHFKNSYIQVMDFFQIKKLDKKLIIRLWDNQELFKNQISNQTNVIDIPFWVIGSSINNKNDSSSRIDYLSLNCIKNIEYHQNITVLELKKDLIHEFVHICHSQFCNYNYPKEEWVREGIATFLSNQYEDSKLTVSLEEILNGDIVEYHNYRYLFNILMNNLSHNEILDILRGDYVPEINTIRYYENSNKL